jgi:TonB family protein
LFEARMLRSPRSGRRVKPATTWTAIAAALALHVAVIGTVHGLGLSVIGEGFAHGRAPTRPDSDEIDVIASCRGDAVLAGTARMALCGAPWRTDTDDCLEDASNAMFIELSGCDVRDGKGFATVAMLEPRQTDKVKPIELEPLVEMLRPEPPKPKPVVVPPPAPAPTQPPPPAPPAPKRPAQVVETAKPSEEKAPDNARFLAEFDTKVQHQTVARGTPNEPMVAKSKPAELAPKESPKEASVKEHEDRPRGADQRAPDVPGTLSMRTPGMPSPAEVEQAQKTRGSVGGATGPSALDGYLARRGDGAIEQPHRDRSETPKGQGGAGGGAPDVPNLKPSQEVLERALGGGNVDHLEEVDSGDETALNAKRWVYASFFNRLKRQVAQNWDPASVWRRSDPTGQVYGFKTRVTEVRVSLSPHGELQKIVVTTPSGVSELDDEAVRAFHSAAPFPNPPKELVTADNLITFAFSFYFEIGAPHTSWRVIRSM